MARMDDATLKRDTCRLVDAGGQDARGSKQGGRGSVANRIYLESALDEGGLDALRVMATGRPAQLDAIQLDGLRAALLQGPLAHGSGRTVDAQARTGAHCATVRRDVQRGTCLLAITHCG
jgi:hypothetical protein